MIGGLSVADFWMRFIELLVLAITCIILLYYTMQTKRQADLLAEQLRIFKKKEMPDLQFLRFESGCDFRVVKCYLRNYGGRASNLSVKIQSPFRALLQPKTSVANGGELEIEVHDLPDPRPEQVTLELSYSDSLGGEHSLKLRYLSSKGFFEVLGG
ncbi:MAG: hypothetical protein ABIJ09_04560 [Pseudomonadota bacterium]